MLIRYSAMALRLRVRLKGPAAVELVNAPLPPVKGHVEERSVQLPECHTPAGLPLRFYSHFRGDWGEVVVMSVETLLLRLTAHVNSHAELRLPTDEVMELSVEES